MPYNNAAPGRVARDVVSFLLGTGARLPTDSEALQVVNDYARIHGLDAGIVIAVARQAAEQGYLQGLRTSAPPVPPLHTIS